MRSLCKTIFIVVCLFFSRMMPAQNLPALPVDGKIQKGVLTSGVSYYIVSNPTVKGLADVALVRRDELPGPETRSQVEDLGRFLSRTGVGFRPEGLFAEVDGATVCRFDDVPVWNPVALDSTLLMSFSYMAASRSDQAIILSGDIDAKDVKRKMDIFSMMVPKIYKRKDGVSDYAWEPSVAPFIFLNPAPGEHIAEVSVSYVSPRTPQKYMNTAQPLVMDIFAREFATIVANRIRTGMDELNMPCYKLEIVNQASSESAGDEKYTVTVGTAEGRQDEAMALIGRTLASLEAFGATPVEFTDAKKVLGAEMKLLAETPLTNAQYVDRCLSSFLYGAHLAPFAQEAKLFSGKTVADTTDRRFFNRIAGGVLDQTKNLTIDYSSSRDSLDDNQILFDYNLAYLQGYVIRDPHLYGWNRGDTTSLSPHGSKVKIRLEKPEPVSGGSMWTYTNGLRVIFRKMPGSGMFSYALQLNGGLSSIPELRDGEADFIPELLFLSRFGGVEGKAFKRTLVSNGITMDVDVSVKDMALTGSAPVQKLPMLMGALQMVTGTRRRVDSDAFASYAASEKIRILARERTREGIFESMYSQIAPEDIYTGVRKAEALTPDLLEKADVYFEDRFSRLNDGVLILVGDLDEETVKKQLAKSLGGFRALHSNARRSPASGGVKSGKSTVVTEGTEKGIYVLMTSDVALTSSSRYASDMAMMVLRRSLAEALHPYGLTAEVSSEFSVYPEERLWVRITCLPANPAGLPADVKPVDLEKALAGVRKGIAAATKKKLSKAELTAAKARVTGTMADALSHPETVVNTVRMRYAMNKDLVTKYKENINAVDAPAVQAILQALSKGSCIEKVVK